MALASLSTNPNLNLAIWASGTDVNWNPWCRSLVGREDIPLQHAFIQAIPHTNVQLFVPSDLAFRCDEQGLRIGVNKEKDDVERAAREAGIAVCVILPCVFAESGLNTG